MRKSKKMKSFLFIALILIFLFHNIFSLSFSDVLHEESTLEIHMINVGQSESFLIIQGNNTMLIDTGEIFYGKTIVKYLSDIGIPACKTG